MPGSPSRACWGQPNIYYVGAVSGGIWNTDGGTYLKLIFEGQPSSSIRHLAVAALDPNMCGLAVRKAAFTAMSPLINGTYSSAETGNTWKHMGLARTGRLPSTPQDYLYDPVTRLEFETSPAEPSRTTTPSRAVGSGTGTGRFCLRARWLYHLYVAGPEGGQRQRYGMRFLGGYICSFETAVRSTDVQTHASLTA
jgi:hypothetical protein